MRKPVLAFFLLASLACGRGIPTPWQKAPVYQPEAPPGPPRPELPAALALDEAVVDRLAAHAANAAYTGSSSAALCQAMEEAEALITLLVPHLRGLPSVTPEAVSALDRAVLGARFTLGPEGPAGYLALDELAPLLTGNDASLLTAAQQMLPAPEPAWRVERAGAICADPLLVSQTLELLAQRWALGSDCLRRQLAARLTQQLRALAEERCYCVSPERAAEATRSLGPWLDRLPDLRGREARQRWSQALDDPATRFGGRCG